jgi:hypothetical protein
VGRVGNITGYWQLETMIQMMKCNEGFALTKGSPEVDYCLMRWSRVEQKIT